MSGFREYLSDLAQHGTTLLIAVQAMIDGADDQGRIRRDLLTEAFKDSYVAHLYSEASEDTAEIARLGEIRRMTAQGVDGYLSEEVLSRLATADGWRATATPSACSSVRPRGSRSLVTVPVLAL